MGHPIEQMRTVSVDGFDYLVQHPQVEEAWEIGIDLLKLIGGSAAAMAGGAKSEESAAKALQVGVDGILAKLTARESMAMAKQLFKYVEVQPKEGSSKFILDDAGIKRHFRGSIGSLLKLLGEVIAFTHRDFFSAVGEGVSELMKIVDEKTA